MIDVAGGVVGGEHPGDDVYRDGFVVFEWLRYTKYSANSIGYILKFISVISRNFVEHQKERKINTILCFCCFSVLIFPDRLCFCFLFMVDEF